VKIEEGLCGALKSLLTYNAPPLSLDHNPLHPRGVDAPGICAGNTSREPSAIGVKPVGSFGLLIVVGGGTGEGVGIGLGVEVFVKPPSALHPSAPES
jgi:hypothetical protein